MDDTLLEKARTLAMRPYTIKLLQESSVGDTPLYIAINPELDGCLAEGDTVEEAEANLAEFRVEYIEHLLQHDLPVPPPASTATTTTSNSTPGQLKLTNMSVSTPSDAPEDGVQLTSSDVIFGVTR